MSDDRLARIEAMLQTINDQIAGLRADLVEQVAGLTLALRRTEARLSSEIAVLEPLITRTDQRLTARVEALEARAK